MIVVWRLDRWGRSVADLMTTLRELTDLGVGFVSLAEALDLTTQACPLPDASIEPVSCPLVCIVARLDHHDPFVALVTVLGLGATVAFEDRQVEVLEG